MIYYAEKMRKKKLIKNITYIQADGIEIEFENEFDGVFSNIVLHWVKEIDTLLSKVYLSLKAGGRIQIATIFDDIGHTKLQKASDAKKLDTKIKINQIEMQILQNFMFKQYYKDIITLEEFQAYQSNVNKNLTYKVYKIAELEERIIKAGFTQLQIDQKTFWNKFDDVGKYFDYRQSNLWLYFLNFFPEKYRPQLAKKLRQLILEEWDKVSPEKREYPIKEKWPVLFIQGEKSGVSRPDPANLLE